ncbi:MAG: hypothetical protein SGJ21_13490 [Alphaproteobacteria bacterium]|nr:hypothetical protein [Alphaproteobacteria bacterium]
MTLPDPARYAAEAARAIGAGYADLDTGGGYLFRISRGGCSVLGGAGAICSYPVNSATSVAIARDKSHAKSVLRDAGLPVIPGGLFFAQTRRAMLRGPGREIADARSFAAGLGYPVFCKPNTGGRGNFAEIIASDVDLSGYAARLAVDFEAFLVEPVIAGVEHRVLIQDGRSVFHSTKSPPALEGDGVSSLAELLDRLNRALEETDVSPYPHSSLDQTSRRTADIPVAGERIPLPGRRNLSTAGAVEEFSEEVPAPLHDLAREAVAALGLRIGAVDLFDTSAARDLSRLVVIEVNGNPGLRTLELAGRMDLIAGIWSGMLNELLEG